MSDLKPLWSDDKTEHHIDCVANSDPDHVVTNLYEDVKCLKERNEELKDIINALEGKNKELESECKRFYGICDDISTYGDMHKPEINNYFKAVEAKAQSGLNDGMLYSDGYKILFKEKS